MTYRSLVNGRTWGRYLRSPHPDSKLTRADVLPMVRAERRRRQAVKLGVKS